MKRNTKHFTKQVFYVKTLILSLGLKDALFNSYLIQDASYLLFGLLVIFLSVSHDVDGEGGVDHKVCAVFRFMSNVKKANFMLLFFMVTVVIREVFQKMVIFLQSDAFLLQTWSLHAHQHYIKIIIVTTTIITVIAKNDSLYVSTDDKVWIFTICINMRIFTICIN